MSRIQDSLMVDSNFPVKLKMQAAADEKGERQAFEVETDMGWILVGLIPHDNEAGVAAACAGGSSSFEHAAVVAEAALSWYTAMAPGALASAMTALYEDSFEFRGIVASMFMAVSENQFKERAQEDEEAGEEEGGHD